MNKESVIVRNEKTGKLGIVFDDSLVVGFNYTDIYRATDVKQKDVNVFVCDRSAEEDVDLIKVCDDGSINIIEHLDMVSKFSHGRAVISRASDEKLALIDDNLTFRSDYYDEIIESEMFYDLYIVKQNEKYGLMDGNGLLITDIKYDKATDFIYRNKCGKGELCMLFASDEEVRFIQHDGQTFDVYKKIE